MQKLQLGMIISSGHPPGLTPEAAAAYDPVVIESVMTQSDAPLFDVVLIGRNEAKTLPRLIASLAEFQARGGAIHLCDTGSTDGTPAVARGLGVTVTEVGDRFRTALDAATVARINQTFQVADEPPIVCEGDSIFDFSAARNFAATLARQDMISMPDCDEAFTRFDIDHIDALIRTGAEQLEYPFVFSHDADGRPGLRFNHSKFYDRRKLRWVRVVHEVLAGEAQRVFVPEDRILLEHWPNRETDRSGYLRGLAYDVLTDPASDRNAHYFGRELMYTGRYRSAIAMLQRHSDMRAWAAERAQSHVYMAECWAKLGDRERQVEELHRAWQIEPNRRIAQIKLAEEAYGRGDQRQTIAFVEGCLHIPPSGFYSDHVAHYTNWPHELAYWAWHWSGNQAKARAHWLRALDYCPQHRKYLHDFRFYYPTPGVTIVVPTLARAERLERLLLSIAELADYPQVEVIVVHNGEPARDAYPLAVRTIVNPTNVGAPLAVAMACEQASHDLVMFLGDDCVAQPGFLVHAVKEMYDSFGPAMDGLVALNDGMGHGVLATHWLASRKLLPRLGDFFSPAYRHCYCDNELTERCRQLGRFTYAEHARIVHDHPAQRDWTGMDAVYAAAYDPETVAHDLRMFESRARELGFPARRPQPAPRAYPPVLPSYDLRPRLEGLGEPRRLKVLNVGMGSGQSGLARQLPFLRFRSLHGIDVHQPYLDVARDTVWDALSTSFVHRDLRSLEEKDFAAYDLVLAFDVLEHLEKADSLEALRRIEASGARAIVFIPLEEEFRHNEFGAESQDHLSYWTEADFARRGWRTEVIAGFHREHGRVWDALWALFV